MMADDSSKTVQIVVIVVIVLIIIAAVIILIFALTHDSGKTAAATASTCPALSAPTVLSVISVDFLNIKVTWQPVDKAVRYKVYVGTVSGFSKANAISTYLTTDTTFTITGMLLGRNYYVRVSAINACGAEGALSAEQTVHLGFPPKFMIVSRDNSNLSMRVSPDQQNVILDTFCSGNPGDDSCIWQYDPQNNFIQSVNTPTNCIKTFPTNVDIRLKYGPCSAEDFYNFITARQWIYDTNTQSLCNPQNPEGLNCAKVNGPAIPMQSIIRIPFDNTSSMRWAIQQVP